MSLERNKGNRAFVFAEEKERKMGIMGVVQDSGWGLGSLEVFH